MLSACQLNLVLIWTGIGPSQCRIDGGAPRTCERRPDAHRVEQGRDDTAPVGLRCISKIPIVADVIRVASRRPARGVGSQRG
jgi:hypothetical protein